jgi:hypothetical protein
VPGHKSDALAGGVHGCEDWGPGLGDAEVVDEGEEVLFVDVVGSEDGAVGAEETEGGFEGAGHADAGDYDWFLGMCVSKMTEKNLVRVDRMNGPLSVSFVGDCFSEMEPIQESPRRRMLLHRGLALR